MFLSTLTGDYIRFKSQQRPAFIWGGVAPDSAHLCGDGGVEPLLGQIDLRDQAVMVGHVSQEDGVEGDDSIGQHAEAEQGEDQQLEATPLTQKGHLLVVVLHGGQSPGSCNGSDGDNKQRHSRRAETLQGGGTGKERFFWLSTSFLLTC